MESGVFEERTANAICTICPAKCSRGNLEYWAEEIDRTGALDNAAGE